MHGPVCKIVLVLTAIFVTLAISVPIHTGTANAAQRSSAPATDSAQIVRRRSMNARQSYSMRGYYFTCALSQRTPPPSAPRPESGSLNGTDARDHRFSGRNH